MTHLILHKVRGEPAFDIAEKIQIGDEEGWIIPTSGHRAYPYVMWPLNGLIPLGALDPENLQYAIPPDWPDHYEVRGEGPKVELNFGAILQGLSKVKFKRRF